MSSRNPICWPETGKEPLLASYPVRILTVVQPLILVCHDPKRRFRFVTDLEYMACPHSNDRFSVNGYRL